MVYGAAGNCISLKAAMELK